MRVKCVSGESANWDTDSFEIVHSYSLQYGLLLGKALSFQVGRLRRRPGITYLHDVHTQARTACDTLSQSEVARGCMY